MASSSETGHAPCVKKVAADRQGFGVVVFESFWFFSLVAWCSIRWSSIYCCGATPVVYHCLPQSWGTMWPAGVYVATCLIVPSMWPFSTCWNLLVCLALPPLPPLAPLVLMQGRCEGAAVAIGDVAGGLGSSGSTAKCCTKMGLHELPQRSQCQWRYGLK